MSRSNSRGSNLRPAEPDNRQWQTDLGNGFIRIDNGAPPLRGPGEPQPVQLETIGSPSAPIEVKGTPAPIPPPRYPVGKFNHRRQDYGLGKRH